MSNTKENKRLRAALESWVEEANELKSINEESEESIATVEEMQEEATERLRALVDAGYIAYEVLSDWNRHAHRLNTSEAWGQAGILYWTDQKSITMADGTPIQNLVNEVESNECVVYHTIHFKAVDSDENSFDMLYCLVVSQYKNEWGLERQDLVNGMPYAYVNTPYGGFDLGPVCIRPAAGGLGPVFDAPTPLYSAEKWKMLKTNIKVA